MLSLLIRRLRGTEKVRICSITKNPIVELYDFERSKQFRNSANMQALAQEFLSKHFPNTVIRQISNDDYYTIRVDCIVTNRKE